MFGPRAYHSEFVLPAFILFCSCSCPISMRLNKSVTRVTSFLKVVAWSLVVILAVLLVQA